MLDMLLFRSCSKISTSFSPLRKVGAGARSLQIRRRENAYPSAQYVSIQCNGVALADELTVICLAASVVGSRWSLEKEERLQSKVRNVDIEARRRVGMQVRLIRSLPSVSFTPRIVRNGSLRRNSFA